MNRYQRHASARVSAACIIAILATTFLAEASFAAAQISGQPQTTVEAGDTYRFNPSVSGLTPWKVRFSIERKPRWVAFNPSTGQLTGRPGKNAVGRYTNIVVRVTDGTRSATLSPFSITVQPESGDGPGAPRLPDATLKAGERYYFKPQVTGFQPGTLRFATRQKPGWLNFNTRTGELQGTPGRANVGQYDRIVVRATDGNKNIWIGPFSIKVTDAGGPNPPPGNRAPTISGSPPRSVTEGSAYNFTPNAADADGDTLTFSVSGLPNWANFNRNTGRIWGTPSQSDVGVHGGIRITVSDGKSSASLNPFDIRVNSRGGSSVTLQWTPPTRNTDGSVLRDLAAYRIEWAIVGRVFDNSVTVNNAGLTSYVLENLERGEEYKFAVYAINSAGVDSERSNVSRFTVN